MVKLMVRRSPRGQGHAGERDQDFVHPGHRRHQIGAVNLGDLRTRARACVVKFEAEFERFGRAEPSLRQAQVRVFEACVAEPEAEGKTRDLVEIA